MVNNPKSENIYRFGTEASFPERLVIITERELAALNVSLWWNGKESALSDLIICDNTLAADYVSKLIVYWERFNRNMPIEIRELLLRDIRILAGAVE